MEQGDPMGTPSPAPVAGSATGTRKPFLYANESRNDAAVGRCRDRPPARQTSGRQDSLRVALGDDAAQIAQDVGHADISVTFGMYTHVMHLQPGDRERLRALVDGVEWAPLGTSGAEAVPSGEKDDNSETSEAQRLQGLPRR